MKTIALALALPLALGLLLSACGGQEEEVAPASGIEGRVLLGPRCPVVREGPPCPDAPYQATIDLLTADQSRNVATFTTDGQGRFHVPLPPGDYYLDPQPADGPFPRPVPQTVTVPPDRFLDITIQYDTGVR